MLPIVPDGTVRQSPSITNTFSGASWGTSLSTGSISGTMTPNVSSITQEVIVELVWKFISKVHKKDISNLNGTDFTCVDGTMAPYKRSDEEVPRQPSPRSLPNLLKSQL